MTTLKFEDGTIIDVNDVLEYEIQSNQLFDFDGVYGVFSNDFTIPLTAEVDELLGFLSVDITEDKRYSKIPVSLIRNGSNFSEGYIVVNGFSEDGVDITYFSNNSDWIENIKDLTTDQLNTRDIFFNWTVASVINAWDNDFNYNFPLINDGSLTSDLEVVGTTGVVSMTYSLPVSYTKLYPCVKVNYLIEKAFKKLGFKVEGNYKNLTNDLFLSSGYKFPAINEKALNPLFNFKNYKNTNYDNTSFGVKFTPTEVLDFCEDYSIINTDNFKLTDKGLANAFRPSSTGWYKGSITFTMKTPTNAFRNLNSAELNAYGQIFLVRSNFSTIELINQTQTFLHFDGESIGGFVYTTKSISFEFQSNSVSDYYFNLQNTIPLFNPNGNVSIVVKEFTLQKRDALIIDGEMVYGDYFIPEVNVADLLREVICRYNCIINTKNKIVTIQSLSNLDYSDSVDITDKISNIISTNYSDLQGDIGQNNLFNVESDIEDYPTLGSGKLKINYKILDKEKEVFSSSFKSFEVTDSLRIPTPFWNFVTGQPDNFDSGQLRFKMAKITDEPRLLIAQRKNVDDIWRNQYNVKDDFWLFTNTRLRDVKVQSLSSLFTTSQNPYFAWYCLNNPNVNLDFNKSLAFEETKDLVNGGLKIDRYSIIAKNYRTVKNIYNKPQILEVEAILNEELDLTKPVYLQQTGRYYLVQNQTVNSDSSFVTLYLIQI